MVGTTFRPWDGGNADGVTGGLPGDPSFANPSFIMRRFCGAASSISMSPRVAAASPMREPTSMKSLPIAEVRAGELRHALTW